MPNGHEHPISQESDVGVAGQYANGCRRVAEPAAGRHGHRDAGQLAARQWRGECLTWRLGALPAEAREHDVLTEDVARLSPLKHANLNVLGRYSFRASIPAGGGLRPLRSPATADAGEEDEPQVCSAGAGIAVRGASPLREELVRPQRTAKGKGKEVTHSLPLSTYSAPGAGA